MVPKNQKKPGIRTPPLYEETPPKFPGFPDHETFFTFQGGRSAGLWSGTFRGILTASAAERAVPFPAGSTRLIHLNGRGSMGTVCSGPKQVAMKFSPEGDPTLVWVRPAGRLPVTFCRCSN